MGKIKRELCGECAHKLAAGFTVRKVAGGVDNKVQCQECGKRRYGGTYEIAKGENAGG